jgi:hypothetical protein
LYIRVLNELKAPPSVATSIDCLVYASAGPDFEVAVPSTALNQSFPLVPQIGGVDPAVDQTLTDGVVGAYDVGQVNMVPSSQCIGEMFTSIKQLLTRYTPLLTKADVVSANPYIGLYPFVITNCTAPGQFGDLINQPALTCDALSYFAPGFVFFRGRVKIMDTPDFHTGEVARILEAAVSTVETRTSGTPYLVTAPSYGDFFGSAFLLESRDWSNLELSGLSARQVFDPINGLEVSVPYYCKTRMTRVNHMQQSYLSVPVDIDTPMPYLRIQRKNGLFDSDQVVIHRLFRACADDFQLSYFIGFPPLALLHA